jgi:predicted transcriptional regulator
MAMIELNGNRPRRRDKLIIMTEIIGIAIKGTSKTQIMYKANLSFSQLKRYLALLSRHSLLKKSAYNGREIYKATPKGVEFMERQQQVIDLINEEPAENGMKPYPFNYNPRPRVHCVRKST